MRAAAVTSCPRALEGKRVALVIQTAFPNGIAEARGIARTLAAHGVATSVLCTQSMGTTKNDGRLDVIELGPIEGRLGRIRYAQKAAAALRSLQPDIAHVYSFRGFGMLPMLARGPKYVIDVRTGNVSGRRWTALADRVTRFEARRYDHRAVISRSVGRYVCGRSWDDSTVIPLGFPQADADYASAKVQARTPDVVTAGYVGTLHPERRLEVLLDAARMLRDRSVPVRFTFVGGGPAKARLEQHARNIGVADIVEFRGAVGNDDVWRHYADIDISLAYVPSSAHFYRQPPLKTIESMACGLAVVGSDTEGNRDFLHDERDGILVPDTAAAFADATARLARDPARRQALGLKALESAAPFSWDRIVSETVIPMYESLLS